MKKFLSILLLSVLLGSLGAKADAEMIPYKVLGRGLQDKRTGEALQMACVGEEQFGERSCGKLRFLYAKGNGHSELIGPTMEIDEDGGVTRGKVKEALREQHLAKPVIPGNRIFQASQAFYLGKRSTHRVSNDLGVALPAFFLPVGYGLGKAMGAVWFNGGLALTGSAALFSGGMIVAIPLVVDLVLLPIQIHKVRKEFGYLFGDLGKDVSLKALQDRATDAWQLKPHPVSHKGFVRFIAALEKV